MSVSKAIFGGIELILATLAMFALIACPFILLKVVFGVIAASAIALAILIFRDTRA